MTDLFDAPAPSGDGYYRPRPWDGCDTSSEAWRAYCEAWTLFQRHNRSGDEDWEWRLGEHFRSVRLKRGGDAAVAALKRNIGVVEQDIHGMIADRSKLPDLLH